MKDGYGKYNYDSGDSYIGEFRNNLRDGTGTYYGADFRYVGNYRNNKREGDGVCRYDNGNIKSGLWMNGVLVK